MGLDFEFHLFFQEKQDVKSSNIEQTQHTGREGEQDQVTMCCLETTVCFSPVIVRGLCDVCRNINSVTFVTDEQNFLPLCPGEDPTNLVAVRIPLLSVRSR